VYKVGDAPTPAEYGQKGCAQDNVDGVRVSTTIKPWAEQKATTAVGGTNTALARHSSESQKSK